MEKPPPWDVSGHQVDNYLLIEILSRLPSTKSVFRFISVSKTWQNLISSPYFVRRFINHNIKTHSNDDDDNDDISSSSSDNSSGIVFSYTALDRSGKLIPGSNLCLVSDNPMFQKLDLVFTDLAMKKQQQQQQPISVLAVFNDLFLCSVRHEDGIMEIYICNPFTGKSVALPPPPTTSVPITKAALVCKPHFYKDGDGEYAINQQYKYRAVLITHDALTRRLGMFIYCSESGDWSELSLQYWQSLCFSNVVVYNGKLHWYNRDAILVLDPFDAQNTLFINGSQDFQNASGRYCLGVCRGFLRLMRVSNEYCNPDVTVWELKDRNSGKSWKWSLEHHFAHNLYRLFKLNSHDLFGLACHPTDPDMVYFRHAKEIISCNLKNGDWNVVGGIFSEDCLDYVRAFPVVLPLWPTPIPASPQASLV